MCNGDCMHEESIHDFVISKLTIEKKRVHLSKWITMVEVCWQYFTKLFYAFTIYCFFCYMERSLTKALLICMQGNCIFTIK